MSLEESLCIRNIKIICLRRITKKYLRSTCIAQKYTISTNHIVASNYIIDVTKKFKLPGLHFVGFQYALTSTP
jgi:hypothetical protein